MRFIEVCYDDWDHYIKLRAGLKKTEWDEGRQGRELYDHENDADEIHNLTDDPARYAIIEELSRKLRDAVKTSFPADGQTPALRQKTWAPNLTEP